MNKQIHVPESMIGQRIDAVLAELAPEYSRSSWKKLIKNGHIHLGADICLDPAHVVKSAHILVALPEEISAPHDGLEIVHMDDDVLVVIKPAGILSHAKGQVAEEWTVADFVRQYVTEDTPTNRPGIVHRLDRGTSGIMIVARTNAARSFLQREFTDRKVHKTYRAVVHGVITDNELDIQWPIARNPKTPSAFYVHHSGKTAQTSLKVAFRGLDYTCVELKPSTGRTHQLRVHLNHLGHPIVGDATYVRKKSSIKTDRMMLHAYILSIRLPSGGRHEFTAPIPGEFKSFWHG